MKNLVQRVLMAAWGIPVILGLSYLGGYYFLFLVLLINGIALWEFYSVFKNQNIFAYRITATILSTIFITAGYFLNEYYIIPVLLFTVLVIHLKHLIITRPNSSLNTANTLTGLIYVSFFLLTLLKIRQNFGPWYYISENARAGGIFIVIIWIGIWICDTFAYFGGRLFGRHKLAPLTSPNKTVEGAVLGLIGAVFTLVGLGSWLLPFFNQFQLFLIGILVGTFGQLGDLVESRYKRDAGVKDTSTILPGHGGFLDRFDSIIFISPVLYIVLQFI